MFDLGVKMATITRCDECKKLSDEQGISYIGRTWTVSKYRDVFATITTKRDVCRECLLNLVSSLSLNKSDGDEDY